MSGFEGQEYAVKDLKGNWWYQDPATASWYIWTGKNWKRIPGASPRIVPQRREPAPQKRLSGSCMLTLITSGLVAMIVVGAISLVAYNFIPPYHINLGGEILLKS